MASRDKSPQVLDWVDTVADQSVNRAATLCADAGLDCKLNDQSVTGEMISSAPNTLRNATSGRIVSRSTIASRWLTR